MLGFFAVVIAVGFSAFTAPKKSEKRAGPFYWVMANPADETDGDDRIDKTKYVLGPNDGETPVTCPNGAARLCQLFLVDDGAGKPNISSSPTDPLRIKLYNGDASAPQAQTNVIFVKSN